MKEIQKDTLDRALSYLIAVGCQFAVIDPDGNKYGALQVVMPKIPGKRNLKYPYGTVAAHLRPYLEKLNKLGDYVAIPLGQFDPKHLLTAVGQWCEYHHKGRKVRAVYLYSIDGKKVEAIEAMRVEE
jgi:hypothetical protein